MSDELFQLSNGRYITSEDISRKLYYIKDHHPETAYQDDSTGYSWDEAGMADLFSECYQNDTRYCPEAKSWYTYETGKWHKDVGALLVSAKIKEFVRLMALYCGEITDEEKRKQYMAFVGKMGDRRFRDRLMKDAADSMKIAAAQFDTHPYLINCLNGTYDLEHMKFREHRWDDFLTMQTNFEYTLQEVTCPRWEQFIKEVTQNEADKADYLQRALGYSILGTSKEECMFILHGKTTRNGKSTLMESVLRVFGDYGLTVAPETIAAKQRNSSGPSEDLARLAGRRLANISEPSRGMRLNAAQVKSMTGNDSINARFLHCNSFDFRPQFKLYINTNYLPSVDDMSLFSSNRVRVIPFDRHFEPQEQDPNLKHLFAEEDAKSAILNWLIAGWRLLQKEGLNSPAAVVEATKEYSHDSNKIALFAEDNLEPDANREVRTSEIYAHYKVWCEVNGCLPENSTNFKKSLQAIGTVVRKRPRDGSEKTTLLLGYRLK